MEKNEKKSPALNNRIGNLCHISGGNNSYGFSQWIT
jgi:hypothetical protein